MVKVNSLVSLLALGSSALAFEQNAERGLTTTLGPKSTNHVPTTWHSKTKTVTVTEKLTVTPHPTVTPTKTTTKTIVSTIQTSVLEPTSTDVVSTTVLSKSTCASLSNEIHAVNLENANICKGTHYATVTNVVTETDITSVTTTITTTPTTTIDAPADFTPITQNQDYVAKVKARSAKHVLERGNTPVSPKQGLHPQAVTCNKLIEPVVYKRVTITAKPQTITAPPKTKTITTHVTTTHTNTLWPAEVTSTVTFGKYTTVTSTIESTTTNYIYASSKIHIASV
jgi:hypothetical protein